MQSSSSSVVPLPKAQAQRETQEFFAALYGESPAGWLTIWDRQTKQTRWFPAAQLSAAARKALELAPSCDVYFGLGLRAERLTSGRGELDHICAVPGLWLDVDCAGGTHAAKNLPDRAQARQFLSTVFPPASILVDSGGGLHAYWLFRHPWMLKDAAARQKAVQQMETFQRGMIALAAQRGWKLDNTSDLPRVLRVPNTLNHKRGQGEPLPVTIIERNDARYGYDEIKAALTKLPRTSTTTPAVIRAAATRPDGSPGDPARIMERCAFFRHCVEDAADLPELEWYAALTIAARTQGGREYCHEISRPYHEYSERETDDKINHALNDTGPYTCERIRLECPGWCDNCPERVTSPIVLGTPPDADEIPVEQQIQALPETLNFEIHQNSWRTLIRSVARKSPVQQEQYIRTIAARFKIGVGTIRKEIKAAEAEQKLAPAMPVPLTEPRAVDWSLAQDMRGDVFHYGTWLPTDKGEYVFYLVKSDGHLEPGPEVPGDRLPKDAARWSVDRVTPYNVFAYLDRQVQDSPVSLFQDLRAFFRRFMWYSDERTYDLLALWVMSTYVFMVFDQVGYLALVGTKRAGKTRLFELLELLCFNAVLSTSVSDSYVFRSVEVDRTTLLVDEADQLKQQAKEGVNERLEILRSGYRRSGNVGRIEGEDRRRVDFSTYSCKAIANVSGLEDALEDRTLAVPVERKPSHIKVEKVIHRRLRPEAQILRNRLYCFGLTAAAQIARIYDTIEVAGVDDREAEIWSGLLSIAHVAAPERIDALLALARENSARKELHEGSESIEAQEILAIWQLVNEEQPSIFGTHWFQAGRIQEAIKDQLSWDSFSYQRMATDLAKLRIIEDTSEYKQRFRLTEEITNKKGETKTKTRQAMCYQLLRERVEASAKRFGVALAGDFVDADEDELPY